MALFAYKAMDAAGRLRRGRLSAAHADDLDARLTRMGLDLVSFQPAPTRAHLGTGIGRRNLVDLCFQLEQLTRAGVPLVQALQEIHAGLEKPRLRDILAALVDSLEQGQSLSAALEAHPQVFDAVFIALVRVGEQAGRLPEVLADLAETLRRQDELATRVAQVLAYPAFVATVVLGVWIFLMGHVVPQLATFIAGFGGELPLTTRALLATSGAVGDYGPWLLAIVLLGAPVLLAKVRRDPDWQQGVDGWLLRLWLIGPIRHKAVLTRVVRVIALLYRAGVPVLDALATAETAAGNRAVAHAVARARKAVLDGVGLGRAFQQAGLFPSLVVRMMTVGESTGALDTALLNVCDSFEREVKERIARLERAMEPAVTLVLGALLGWIVLAVLGPVYDLVGTIR